jgi:AcrR family transcriptional regulator
LSAQPALVTYARQRDSSNKSRVAILAGAKSVISRVGNYQSNIVDIAVSAQVSKATIYNQFADKAEMMEFLIDSEITRLTDLAIARSHFQSRNPCAVLSVEISQDLALRQISGK